MEAIQQIHTTHTFSGKKMGNQLIIPSLLASMVFGLVDSSTPLYRTVSKYPASPWQVPRCGIGNVSVLLRALCALLRVGSVWICTLLLLVAAAAAATVVVNGSGFGNHVFGC